MSAPLTPAGEAVLAAATRRPTPRRLRIQVQPASDYDREQYGIVLESVTRHDVTGPGVGIVRAVGRDGWRWLHRLHWSFASHRLLPGR